MENDKLVRASDIFPALQSAGVPYNYATQRVIEQLPAVDAVEVVRCRKCVHWGQGYHHKTPTRMGLCARFTRWTPDKFYCGEGQRREDGDA